MRRALALSLLITAGLLASTRAAEAAPILIADLAWQVEGFGCDLDDPLLDPMACESRFTLTLQEGSLDVPPGLYGSLFLNGAYEADWLTLLGAGDSDSFVFPGLFTTAAANVSFVLNGIAFDNQVLSLSRSGLVLQFPPCPDDDPDCAQPFFSYTNTAFLNVDVPVAVPEPSTLALVGIGLLTMRRWRQRRR